MHGSSVSIKASMGKHVTSMTNWGPDSSERSGSPFEPELALNTERKYRYSKNMNDQEALSYSFIFVLLLFISQPLILKAVT